MVGGEKRGGGTSVMIEGTPNQSENDPHKVIPSSSKAGVITPCDKEQHAPDIPLSPPSVKVVQHTDVRARALGVKAELEALRSKQLAQSIRNDIVDNGKSIPLSSTEVQDFYLRKTQMDKAWRKEQKDSMEYLHSYKNTSMAADTIPRSSQTKREFSSSRTYSELDRFYQKQRAMDHEWRKQQQDSLAYLHNYRDNTTSAAGANEDGGETSGHVGAVVTPGPNDECHYDIAAAIAFHEMQKTMQERLELAINCPLPPDSPALSTPAIAVEMIEPLEESLLPPPSLDDSLTKLLGVVEDKSSSSTKEVYEDSTTSVEAQPYEGEEGELSDCVQSAKPVERDGHIEVFEDSQNSTEVNSVEAEPAQMDDPDPDVTAELYTDVDVNICQNNGEPTGFDDEDNDLLDELLSDQLKHEYENSEPLVEDTEVHTEPSMRQLDPAAIDPLEEFQLIIDEEGVECDTESRAESECAGGVDDQTTPTIHERLPLNEGVEETNTLEEFDRLVEFMSPDISSDTAPDNLEELLEVETAQVGEERSQEATDQLEPVKGTTTNETNTASHNTAKKSTRQAKVNAPNTPPRLRRTKTSKTNTASDVAAKSKFNASSTQSKALKTPPRRQSTNVKGSESKIIRPRQRISIANHSRDSNGLPHYMTPTLSTPERRSKVVTSTHCPSAPRSPLYSRRETAESFKLKSHKCTNKWIPSLHSSRDGCERCLHFADEDERHKFRRNGHHPRICLVRGGCTRSCPCFPRETDQPPVRLCRKCFYDTHRLGKM